MSLPTYIPAECCAPGHCVAHDTASEPCYGQVDVIDREYDDEGGYTWIHACEGHARWPGPYQTPPSSHASAETSASRAEP